MPKLKVELMDVFCRDTEDITGADDFYLVGALAGGGSTKAILTRPVKINDKQTKTFRKEDSVLFEGDVPQGQSIKGGIQAYDEDAAKSWERHGETVKNISNAVSSALTLTGPQGAVAGTILSAATKAAGFIGALDKDDLLGSTELEISATGPAYEERAWKMAKTTGTGWSTWDYTVRYRIERS